MMDYLNYRNILDVFQLHRVVEIMPEFHEQRRIFLPIETLTLSGAANKFLHRSNKSEGIFLFGFKNNELYQSVRINVVGGHSIVFSCYEEANETETDDANVKSSVGYDAKGLSFSTIGGNMPTGSLTQFLRCQKQNCLVAKNSDMQKNTVAFMAKQHHSSNPS